MNVKKEIKFNIEEVEHMIRMKLGTEKVTQIRVSRYGITAVVE